MALLKITVYKFNLYYSWALMAFILFYMIAAQCLLPKDAMNYPTTMYDFSDGWYSVDEDGNRQPADLNNVSYDGSIYIENSLPETLEKDVEYLMLRAGEAKVYIDGELRLDYNNARTRAFFSDVTTEMYIIAEIRPEDAGKTIGIWQSSANQILHPIRLGSATAIRSYISNAESAESLLGLLALAFGCIATIGSVVVSIRFKKKTELNYLGCGVSLVAAWILLNAVNRELLFPNVTAVSDCAYLIVTALPYPFLLYLNAVQKNRYQKLYRAGCIICAICDTICILLHVSGIVHVQDTFFCTSGMVELAILIIGLTMICDIKKKKLKEYKFVAIGMGFQALSAIMEIISFSNSGENFRTTWLALGLLAFAGCAIVHTVMQAIYMEQAVYKLHAADQAKGQFLANMSHELRTPINAVLGMDEVILRETTEENIKEYAMDIQNAGKNLLSLVNDILDFSKIESGKLELTIVEYDFSSMIYDLMNIITLPAENKGLEFQVSIDETIPARMYGDDVRIHQVVLNLLTNAVKYTEKGSVFFRVSGERQGEDVLLHFEIEDTGIGIKEEDIPRLFEKFERIEEMRNRNIQGTGLGMNITSDLLKKMDSELIVQSVYGKGSCFSFDLRQKIALDENIGNLEQRIKAQKQGYKFESNFILPEAKILVVDDNAVNRKVFINLLSFTKAYIDEAQDGIECLKKIEENDYDIIFLDHMMPNMDGLETLEEMQKREDFMAKKIPVIALTANAISGMKEMYLEKGFDAYLSKPIIQEKLDDVLLKFLPEDKVIRGIEEDASVQKKQENENAGENGQEVEQLLQKLEDMPELTLEYARVFTKDSAMLLEVVRDYAKAMKREAEILEEFLEEIKQGSEEAIKQYRIKVHSMKSTSAMAGVIHLSGVAKTLEYAAMDEKLDVIMALTPLFLEQWRELADQLEPLFSEEESTDGLPFSQEEVSRLLEELTNAMDDMDYDEADRLVDEIKGYEIPTHMRKDFEMIFEAVMNLDEKITKECAERLAHVFTEESKG